jgi:ribonuclease E
VVRQVERGLDAAFIDFGERRSGFLHLGNVHPAYSDRTLDPLEVTVLPSRQASALAEEDRSIEAGSDDESEPDATVSQPSDFVRPRIADLLQVDQVVLVQVLRDPVRGKGATLTTVISLAGRKVVLVPSLGRVGVSRRIQDADERKRLSETIESKLEETGLGGIARTAALNADSDDILQDLNHLLESWQGLIAACKEAEAPSLLVAEAGAAARAVRDLFSPELSKILVDDEEAASGIEAILERYVPGHGLEVERYSENRPLFETLGLERDWQNLQKARVPIEGGASIVIHETEALTAIDVNSGRIDKGSLEETAFEANRLAALEMARQIRLRDIGGIIVGDFIDMQDPEHRYEIIQFLREALRKDRARLKLGKMSSFGLLPMTRRRLGAGLPRGSEFQCNGCGGSGTTSHHRGGALRLLRRLRAVDPGTSWKLRVHPGVREMLEGAMAPDLAKLELSLKTEADIQVPSGEPVLERLAP